jgi:myo-inositol-1(or 4)-monophosphatase
MLVPLRNPIVTSILVLFLSQPVSTFNPHPCDIRRRCTRLSSVLAMDDVSVVLDQIQEVAVAASKKAGTIILGNAGGAAVTECKANSRDLLTLIDPLCEEVIRETVLAAFPDHGFLGEEDVPPGKDASAAALNTKLDDSNDWLWIVDPIDGTSNFVHGMPLCMPSIAATYRGEVMVGVIYDPHRDELFTAIKGRGAYMNGDRIRVGEQAEIGDAIVAMGSPPGEESMTMSLRGIQALMPKVRTIRMLGSAALMLAWVANGRLTCYWEYDLSSWDIAAGALLITEAGGRFTDLAGNDYSLRTRKICGSNSKVHDELIRILRDEAGVI